MFENSYGNSVALSLAIFIAFFLIGWFVVAPNDEMAQPLIAAIQNEMGALSLDDDPMLLMIQIFLNNLTAALFLFLGGAVLGVVTGYVLLTNGFVIGLVMGYMTNLKGITLSLVSIVPHGIFELSAFFIASAMGFMLAESVYREYYGSGDAADTAKGLGIKFVTIVIPMLFLAAFVESFITPVLMNMVM